jgi:hypothetical protein
MVMKYEREYTDILFDLMKHMESIEEIYGCFDMSKQEWGALAGQQRLECIRTLADDVFYGLGAEPVIEVGRGTVQYDSSRHLIQIYSGQVTSIVHLV